MAGGGVVGHVKSVLYVSWDGMFINSYVQTKILQWITTRRPLGTW